MAMVATESKYSSLKDRLKQYEYEIILLAFFLLRFVFKNLLGLKKFFTQQPVFGLSDKYSIFLGTAVLVLVCIYLALLFGHLIRRNGKEFERPFLLLVSLFFACPATLPFLFNTQSLSGTQMLYPYAIFILTVFLMYKTVVKWSVPFICALYFLPAIHTSEFFFSAMRKGALLYVPLILLLLFLDMKKELIAVSQKQRTPIKRKSTSGNPKFFSSNNLLFEISLLVSIISYIYTLVRGKSYSESFFNTEQKFNAFLFICLMISAPILIGAAAVLYNAIKNKYNLSVFRFFGPAIVLLFVLSKNNYYGLWIPCLILSMSFIVFNGVWQKNPPMLNAVCKVGDFLWKYNYLFFIVLIGMASFSNTTTSFLSDAALKIFDKIPY